MTTVSDGAPDSGGAVDPFRDLHQLLPKLTKPSWVRLIGTQLTPSKAKAKPASTAAQKAARRNLRKLDRLQRALAGEHTRAA